MVERATKIAARPGRPDVSDGCCSTDGSLVADTGIKIAQPIVCGQEDMEYVDSHFAPFSLASVNRHHKRGCYQTRLGSATQVCAYRDRVLSRSERPGWFTQRLGVCVMVGSPSI